MSTKYLFSPIGNTDPIKYFYDGSMLHICRVYRPDVVYLYFSKEMIENEKKDQRYTKTLELLGEKLGHSFEIRKIYRPELVNVQEYDYFYDDFRNEIRKIAEGMEKEDELYLNMASGTPAMKSALLVIATLTEYQFRAIQVSSPKKMSNLEHEERREYDVAINWDLDADNEETFENRCQEVKCRNLIELLKKDMLKKHILAYDYYAAWEIGQELSGKLDEETLALLTVAKERIKLNAREMDKWIRKYRFELLPVKDGNKRMLFEYAAALQIKVLREEYADFIRGITPLLVDLYKLILEKYCKIDISPYTYKDAKGKLKWDPERLKGSEILNVLQNKWGEFRGNDVYSIHIVCLIQAFSNNQKLNQIVSELSVVEQEVRNVAAHEIVSVTDEWVQKKTGKMPKDIMRSIQYLCGIAGISDKADCWKTYDAMNALILEKLS